MESQTILQWRSKLHRFYGQSKPKYSKYLSNVPYEVVHLKEEETIFKEGDGEGLVLHTIRMC